MQVDQRRAAGRERAVERDGDSAAIAQLRATCRRQAWAIETMTRVLVNLRTGVAALKAENAELRAAAAADLSPAPDPVSRVLPSPVLHRLNEVRSSLRG